MNNTFKMLIKRKNDEVHFVENGEYGCIYNNPNPTIISDKDYEFIMSELHKPNVKYYAADRRIGINGEHYDLYHNISRLAGTDNANNRVEFTLEYVEFDFNNYTGKILKSWKCIAQKYTEETSPAFIMIED